ncbi:uncharacterized protein LOC142750405 [Rhinoderma darwinii]|uniref:uncharacterized protein LOC142750405 n=1 Tax=Rhinoderma darwinii TaxID=43563 RepID=UPI003F66B636
MPRGMDVERLLVLVQGHPEIWDTRSEAYHNRTAKEDAWEEVAKELFGQEWESGRTRDRSRLVQEIKTRWRSCRDQFRREMGERGRSGDGASRKRPYMYTQQLMFLKDIMEMRTTTDNLEDTAEETDVGESRPEPPAAPVLPPSPEPTPLEPTPGQSARAVASPAEERPCLSNVVSFPWVVCKGSLAVSCIPYPRNHNLCPVSEPSQVSEMGGRGLAVEEDGRLNIELLHPNGKQR